MPPLVVVPLPEEDETPDEDDSPADDEVPEDLLTADVPADEVLVLLDATCLTGVDVWAKVAPMPAAAAADSRPTCQVIFLTRRWPRSLDWRAAATSAAGATGLDLVTNTALPVIFCCRAEELLNQPRVSRHRWDAPRGAGAVSKVWAVCLGVVKKITSFRPDAVSRLPYRCELSAGFRARGGR